MPANQPMLILHTIWMDHYEGFEEDIGAGGFDYAQEHGYGHELFNFKKSKNQHFGYVETKNGTIAINRLGAAKSDEWIDDILVVWTAPHPEGDGRFVVGWYKNARVYRDRQKPTDTTREYNGENVYFSIKAASKDCLLLPPEQRTHKIPHNVKGAPGQASTFFPANTKHKKIASKLEEIIREYIGSDGQVVKPNKKRPNSWGKVDPEHRKKVENAAIDMVTEHYENLNYTVESVESQNFGWDLQAHKGDKFISIEVKGLSGSSPVVEVTPNELAQIRAVEKKKFKGGVYRLAIVTKALLKKPILQVFSYSKDSGLWVDLKTGQHLEITERTAAKIEAKN